MKNHIIILYTSFFIFFFINSCAVFYIVSEQGNFKLKAINGVAHVFDKQKAELNKTLTEHNQECKEDIHAFNKHLFVKLGEKIMEREEKLRKDVAKLVYDMGQIQAQLVDKHFQRKPVQSRLPSNKHVW